LCDCLCLRGLLRFEHLLVLLVLPQDLVVFSTKLVVRFLLRSGQLWFCVSIIPRSFISAGLPGLSGLSVEIIASLVSIIAAFGVISDGISTWIRISTSCSVVGHVD
jgi:hypothetical protein